MKVIAYARTSFQEQEEGGFPSLEEQERALRAFAERTGLTLDKVHTDYGLTPTQATRAGLINILDDMESDWEAVLITAPCRLRNLTATFSFDPVEELRTEGKRVLITNDTTAKQLAEVVARIKATRPAPVRRVKGDTARHKREVAQRLLRGREEGARAGKHQSGPAPFGYRRDYSKRSAEGVRLVPDEVEADVVKMIFREYLRLRSMKRLIKLLDEQGLKTRRGKQWSRAGVSWILKNDTYIGRVHFGDIRVKGQHESIVAPITFNKVQQLIRVNNKRGRTTTKKTTKKSAAKKSAAKKTAKKAAKTTTPKVAKTSEVPVEATPEIVEATTTPQAAPAPQAIVPAAARQEVAGRARETRSHRQRRQPVAASA